MCWRDYGTPVILIILFLCGCVSVPETIRDIQDLKQDHLYYISPQGAERDLISPNLQKRMDDSYNSLYFAPWHQEKPLCQLETVAKEFRKYKKYLGYGENRRRHGRAWIKNLAENARLSEYPNSGIRAVTVNVADLRVLPTHRPHFYDMRSSSRGYPFDSLQRSSVAANTPLYISHVSRDRAWYLVETPYAPGWMSVRDVAFVDDRFVEEWETGKYIVIVKDRIPLYAEDDLYLFRAPLGSIFPKVEETESGIGILVAVADGNRKAVIKRSTVRKEAATTKPLRLTTMNIARLSNELINEAYGWGGLYQNRDCSAMIRDLFAPFGLWLPRHSADQAKEGGTFIDLRNLSPEEKELMIMKYGIPYLTLLWKRGHIMLYIGHHQGKVLVFHNMWGVPTRDLLGRKGRKIVGHAAITTLHPGSEFINVDFPEDVLSRGVAGMIILAHPLSAEPFGFF